GASAAADGADTSSPSVAGRFRGRSFNAGGSCSSLMPIHFNKRPETMRFLFWPASRRRGASIARHAAGRDLEQLDFENERGHAGNIGRATAGAVAEFVRHDKAAFFAFAHQQQAEFPTVDYFAAVELETEGRVGISGLIELSAVEQFAFIEH